MLWRIRIPNLIRFSALFDHSQPRFADPIGVVKARYPYGDLWIPYGEKAIPSIESGGCCVSDSSRQRLGFIAVMCHSFQIRETQAVKRFRFVSLSTPFVPDSSQAAGAFVSDSLPGAIG